MQITLNGEARDLDQVCTLVQLIDKLALTGKLAIEINNEVIPRSSFQNVKIKAGDRIEVVRAVGGG